MGDGSNTAPARELANERGAAALLEARLAAEIAEQERLRSELGVRNCALDAAASHFIIGDATRPGWPVVYVNRAIVREYGYEPSELLGKGPNFLLPQALNRIQLKEVMEALRSGHEVRTELRGRRKDGSVFWVGAFIAPVKNAAGRITHYVGVGADISARLEQERVQRQLQDQLYSEMQERERMAMELQVAQKLESVGRLAAGIAHEINTPIQYIGDGVAFLQTAYGDHERLLAAYRHAFKRLAAGEPLAAALDSVNEAERNADLEFLGVEVPKAFERTLEGIGRVASIVRAMKEFAHPQRNEQSPANLNHAIETTLIVAHNEYKYTATVETQLGAIPEVICNIGELNQVFLNVIVNAAQAIEDAGKDVSGGRITVTTDLVRDSVVISIQDNGCGIPEENLEKIFDPFFTTKGVGRGTGQGLAIARSIVTEKHGGSIDVQSTVGTGTRFIIRLPVNGRAAPPAKGVKAA
jgi:PAS domain S-box-containing protein